MQVFTYLEIFSYLQMCLNYILQQQQQLITTINYNNNNSQNNDNKNNNTDTQLQKLLRIYLHTKFYLNCIKLGHNPKMPHPHTRHSYKLTLPNSGGFKGSQGAMPPSHSGQKKCNFLEKKCEFEGKIWFGPPFRKIFQKKS